MQRTKPNEKMKKIVKRLVGEDSSLASAARLLIYRNDDLYKLEVLASVLNDVAPDSPAHWLAELTERLVTTPPAQQEWVRQPELACIVGPTPCTPAPGSPLYALNKFLGMNPCFLRIEGFERASGNVGICATHVPIPLSAFQSSGIDRTLIELMKPDLVTDRILWLLWEVFYRHIDLARLKKCTVCQKWFVDRSKNKSQIRCSTACTWQRWSWAERKKAGHQLPGSKAKGGNHAKAKKA